MIQIIECVLKGNDKQPVESLKWFPAHILAKEWYQKDLEA
jgi:hypothetical protein